MIFILDSKEEVVATLSEMDGSNSATPFFDDELLMDLNTGAETFTFSTLANTPQANQIVVGRYVAFPYKHEYKLFQIMSIEDKHNDEFIRTVYCEMAGIELLNNFVRPFTMNSANIDQFLTNILQYTDWKIGYRSLSVDNVLTIDIKDITSVYQLIQDYAIKKFGAEISFSVKIRGGVIVGKYINYFEQRGDFNGFRFSYSKNLDEVERTIDTSDLATALIGIGNNGIDFKSIAADDKPAGQDFIADEDAYQRWNKNGEHIFGTFTADVDTAGELLTLTRNELKNRKEPNITYQLKTILLGEEDLDVGDTVYVTDYEFEPPLFLSARVSQLKFSFTDSSKNECVLANFKLVKTSIDSQMMSIKNELKNTTQVAKLAQNNSDYAKSQIADLFNDARLTPNEKTVLKNKMDEIMNEKDKFNLQTSSSIQTQLGAYNTSINALNNFIQNNGYFTDMTITSVIDSVALNGYMNDYFTKRADLLKKMAENLSYKIEIISSDGLMFRNGTISTTLQARVYQGSDDITDTIDANCFRWFRTSNFPDADTIWNNSNSGGKKTITITGDDVQHRATFSCSVNI